MKTTISIALQACLASALLFTSCKKDQKAEILGANTDQSGVGPSSSQRSFYAATAPDRIDAIVKDLSLESYSLSFAKPIPEAGITKTAYGADNYLQFADPQNLICPEPIRLKYKAIPIWRRPNIIWPTCPDMIIDIYKLRQLKELLLKADYRQFGGLKEVALNAGGGFLADKQFTAQFANMQFDKIDEITKDLSHDRFLMLNDPAKLGSGATRSFYGYADLNRIVFKPYRKNLKDLLKPTLKGCFDPIVLSTIKKRLQGLDPAYYSNLAVTPLAENNNIAVLSAY